MENRNQTKLLAPKEIHKVIIDGHSLNLEQFVAVARYSAEVKLAESARQAMQTSRALAEKIAEEKRVA